MENTLNKGEISDSFKYDNEIKYPKTGVEIKKQLATEIVKKADFLKQLALRLSLLKEYIEVEPLEETPNYLFNEKRETILNICPFADKIYDEKMSYLDSDLNSRITPRGFSEEKVGFAKDEKQAESCREYNQKIRMCCEIANEISICKTMHDNIEEGKTYQLNLKQLTSLKF